MSTENHLKATGNVTALWNVTFIYSGTEDAQESGLNFLDSFVKALSVMVVSELGDKSFFLAGDQT